MGLNLLSCFKTIFPVCGSVKEDNLNKHVEEDLLSKHVEEDLLSSLPDDVIHKILSFVDIKEAIKMSVLSSRWRIVFNVECGRLDGVSLHRILEYALCFNVQQLTLEHFNAAVYIKIPASVFRSKSLKHLTLRRLFWMQSNKHAPTWELLDLTALHLDHVTFYNDNTDDECIDIFSKCVNLKTLNLNCCTVTGSKGCFRISLPRLSNLTIREHEGKLFTDNHSMQFSTDTLHSLEKLDLCILWCDGVAPSKVFDLLQHLHGVKFLQLNMELVKFLSSSMKVISPQPSKFTQLKSLKVSVFGQQRPLSTEIKNYFLGSSPNASFTFIPRKLIWHPVF